MNRRIAALLALVAIVASVAGAGGPAAAHRQHDGPHYCPKGDSEGFKAERLVGLRVERARNTAERHDCTLRVVRRNGEWLPVTDDFSEQRINVHVRDGRVKRIDGIY